MAIILNAEAEPAEFWADTDLSPFGRKVCAADHVLVITRVRVRTSWTFVSVALGIPVVCRAIDDQTAIKVSDGTVEVVS